MNGLNVVSFFDGISVGAQALKGQKIKVQRYDSFEISKVSVKCSQANHKKIIYNGDIKNFFKNKNTFKNTDLFLAGFPCQPWSMLGNGKGDQDPRGALVHDLIKAFKYLKKKNPNLKFIFENVKMKQEHRLMLDDLFEVKSVELNSKSFGVQSRSRLFWTNIPVKQPSKLSPKVFGHIKIFGAEKECYVSDSWLKWFKKNGEQRIKKCHIKILENEDKALCMTARQYANWNGNFTKDHIGIRKLSIKEMCRLQNLGVNYCNSLTHAQAAKVLGDGWDSKVIQHILKGF